MGSSEGKFQEKKVWFQCVMHDRKNVFMKIVPLGKRYFHHKKATGSEGFLFLCKGDTFEVQINMLNNTEINTDWRLHSQSTLPVPQLDPTPTQQTMLEVVCYPCH